MRRPYVILLLLAGVLLAANLPLVTGRAVPIWDAANFFAPTQALVADHARAGRLLLWDPWMSGGRPDGAEPQSGAFSPLNVAVGLVTGGHLHGFVVYWFLIWWLAGVGTYLLGRALGAPEWGSAMAALATMSSGVFVTNAEHLPFLVALAALPFMVWRLDVALRQGLWLPAAQAGAVWGLSALSGYPGLVATNALFLGLWTLGRCAAPWGVGRRGDPWVARSGDEDRATHASPLRSVVGCWAIFLVVGLIVLAPSYVAFSSEIRGYSDRVEPLDRKIAVENNALAPGALATMASPYLPTLTLLDPTLWSETDGSSVGLYVAFPVLALALVALWNRPRDVWRWWLAGVGLFFLAAAMGQALPVRGVLYDVLLPMRYFRHSAILRAYFVFALIVLALYAARDLAEATDAGTLWRRLATAAFLLGPAAALAIVLTARRVADTGQLAVAAVVAAVIWLAGWILAVLGTTSRRAMVPWCLLALTIVDTGAAIRLGRWFLQSPDLTSWSRAAEARSAELNLGPAGLDRLEEPPIGGRLSNLNLVTKTPVLASFDSLANAYHQRWLSSPVLVAATTGPDRLWFAPAALELAATPDAFERFRRRAEGLGAPPLVLQPRRGTTEPPPEALDALPPMVPLPVELQTYEPNELRLAFDAPADGWLLVTDRTTVGWKAWLDGEPTPVRCGNFLYRAVAVPRGRHEVLFRYRPWGVPGLVILSWLVLAGVTVASVLTPRAPTP